MKKRFVNSMISGIMTMTLIVTSAGIPAYAAGIDVTENDVISTEESVYSDEEPAEIISEEISDTSEESESESERTGSSEESIASEIVMESSESDGEISEVTESPEPAGSSESELMGKNDSVISGILSTGMKWEYDPEAENLRISGGSSSDSFRMPDYDSPSDAPWNEYDYKSVRIGKSVSYIGRNAFAGKESLASVDFDEDSTRGLTIGEAAFRSTGITDLSLPGNIIMVGQRAFAECGSLKSVTFGTLDFPDVTLMFGNSKVESITFPEGCESIPGGLFCDALFPTGFEVTIPASVKVIGGSAFSGDVNSSSNLSKVVFEEESELEIIGGGAFSFTGITEIELPESVFDIQNDAFYATKISELTIPGNVTALGNDAFGRIEKIHKLVINNKGNISATHPFCGTTIDNIVFGEGTEEIPAGLFCDAILTMEEFRIPDGVKEIGEFAICPDNGHSVNKIIIPSTVELIGTSGISNNRRDDDSVIDCYAPAGYYATEWVKQNAAKEKLNLVSNRKNIDYQLYGGTNAAENPYCYDADEETITLYAPKKRGYNFLGWGRRGGNLDKGKDNDGKDIWIYYNTAGDNARDCDNYGNLVFVATWRPETYSITFNAQDGNMPEEYTGEPFELSVGETFPDEYYLEPIKEGGIFLGWYTKTTGGKKITFGETELVPGMLPDEGNQITLYAHYRQSAGTIGKYNNIKWSVQNGTLSFNAVTEGLTQEALEDPDCYAIPDYIKPGTVPWYSLAKEIEEIDLGNIKRIGNYSFAELNISEITLTESLESIGMKAFCDCSSLETVVVDSSRLSVDSDKTFLGCNISNVQFGEGVAEIPASLFYRATFAKGTVITIPNTVRRIGVSAFDAGDYYTADNPNNPVWPQGISGVVFEAGSQLESIGMNAFAYTDISLLSLPSSLREIEDQAFLGTDIQDVIIPDGVTHMGVLSFGQCPELAKVSVPSSVQYVGWMYENSHGKVIDHPEVFSNRYTNIKGVLQSSKTPIQFFAPEGSAGYVYAQTYAEEYNYALNTLVSSLVFYNAGAGDAAKGVEGGLLKMRSNDLMGSTAAQIKEGLDLSVVKTADPGFNETDLLSDKGFVQAVRTDDVIVLDGNEFVKPGFTLTGWKNENTKKILKNGDVLKLGKDNKAVTLTAQWKQDKYSVKYNLNGGKYKDSKNKGITSYKTEFDANTGKYVFARKLLPNCNGEGSYNEDMIVKPGYRFDGWYENKSFTGAAVEYVGGDVFRAFDLYAKWIPEQYEVILNGNKGIQNAKAVLPGVGPSAADNVITTRFEHDKTYKLTTDLYARDGYTLDSWNTKSDGSGRKYAKNAKLKNLPAENRMLYAQWKPVTYKITYDLKGGTIAGAPKTYDPEKGTVINVPVKKGYELSAFYLTMADGSSVTADLNVETKDEEVLHYTIAAATDSKVNYGNIKLTAEWSAKTYKVIYDLNTDKLAPGKDRTLEVSYDYDEQFNISEYLDVLEGRLNDEAKQSMSIASFTAKDNGKGTKFAFNKWYSKLTDGEEVHIYAKWSNKKATRTAWTPVTYKVVINPNYSGGVNKEAEGVKFKDSTDKYRAEDYEPVRDGYTFLGFNTKKNGKGIYAERDTDENGNYYTFEGLSVKNGSTVTLYAIWKANTYRVTYTSDVGFDRNDNPTTIIAGKKYTLSKAVRKGYTFGGWFAPALADNELQKIQGGSIGAILPGNHGDIEFEAAFTENTYSLSLALNGGKDYNEPKIKTYKLDSEIPYTGEIETTLTAAESEFDRAGYVLKGFALDKKGKKMLMYYGEDSDTLNTDSIYYKEGHISGLTDKNKGKVTVYAIWEKVKAERPVISYAYNSGGTIKVGFTVTNTSVFTDYEVQISDNMLFRSGTYISAVVKNNKAEITGEEGKTYYVRVRQRCSDTWGDQVKSKWSAIRSTRVINE